MSASRLAENPIVATRLVRARVGVFATFFVVGFGMAAWLVSIPAVAQRTGVSHATLGLLLLVLGLGGVTGMQIVGYVIQRVGSKIVTAAALTVYVIGVNLPVHATGAISLGFALLIFGVANGAVDVAMNDQAVIVERDYGRPIMSAFHAFWSVGGAAGALVGAAAQAAGLPITVAVLISSVLVAIGGLIFVRLLLPADYASTAVPFVEAQQRSVGPTKLSTAVRSRVIGFGVLAFLLFLAEGVANDWSALHAIEHLGIPAATAALAYATFAVSMTVGRLTVDRIAGRFGPAFVVRYGSLAAAVGLLLVMSSTAFAMTLVGWAIFGLGLSGVVPQIFTAAGNISATNQSILLSRVVGAGYVGHLAGPALVGAVGGWIGLNVAFGLPLVFCLIAVIVAPIVTPRSERLDTSSTTELDPEDKHG